MSKNETDQVSLSELFWGITNANDQILQYKHASPH